MPAAAIVWILPSVAALLIALAVQKKGIGGIGNKLLASLPGRSQSPAPRLPQYATYVIGDLHGDVVCAEYWVQRTGLVTITNNNINDETSSMTWTDPTSHLVFVGDYVDKGPTSRQVVEFVKKLTEQFPNHVTALMGNHEIELLLDRDKGRWESWGGTGYFGLAYSSVHPGEYLNYISTTTTLGQEGPSEEDKHIVEALYNASVEVYGNNLHQKLRLAPSNMVGDENSTLQFIPDLQLRARAAERLQDFQTAYLDAYRSNTPLGTWLEQRPIVAQINDTIFVHGGISNYGSALLKQDGVVEINRLFLEHATEDLLRDFMTQTQRGQIMYDMLTFRGNHQDGACAHLSQLLPDNATRLGVGHTPGKSVRLLCDDKFLAIDSSLGRWFRNSGNLYCQGRFESASKNGHYKCEKINEQCEGQIVKLTGDHGSGPVEVIQ